MKALDLVWGAGLERKSWTDQPTDRYFRGLEMATMRDGWDSPKGWFVGFKAGTNAVNHSHLDVGTFVIDAKGIRWAVQLGPDAGVVGHERAVRQARPELADIGVEPLGTRRIDGVVEAIDELQVGPEARLAA